MRDAGWRKGVPVRYSRGMNETIKIRYSAPSNITFHGEIDTKITREEWAETSQKEQAEVIDDYTAGLLDIGVVGE